MSTLAKISKIMARKDITIKEKIKLIQNEKDKRKTP